MNVSKKMEIAMIKALANDKCSSPIIYGSAQRVSNDKNDKNRNEYSISLKDLSMPEIFKLAEERAENAGKIRRSPNNLLHKRMAVSESVTRNQALMTDRIASKKLGLTSRSDQSDNTEEFFENLYNKMIAEQFVIRPDQTDGSKKRTLLWDKENMSSFKKIKRRVKKRANAIQIPSIMESFKERLATRQHNAASSTQLEIRPENGGFETNKQERDLTLWRNSALDLTQEDTNMEESNLNLIDYGSPLAAKKSFNDSCHSNWIVDNGASDSSRGAADLRYNCTIDRFDQGSDRPVMLCDHYTKPYHSRKPYLIVSNIPNNPCLSTIEECHEPSVTVPPLVQGADDREFDRHSNVSLNFTRPLSPELGDFDDDHFGIDRGNSVGWHSLRTITCSSGDFNHTSNCLGNIEQ